MRPHFVAILVAILVLLLVSGGTASAQKGGPMGKAQLWPAGLNGWTVGEGPTDYTPSTAYTYMDGAAELFLAYNMKNLTVVRYEKPKRPAIVVEVYTMGSPEDAYGLFSFETDDPGAGIGQGSEFGGGLLRFWKGPYFVSVYGDGTGEDVEKATLSLGREVASAITETGNPPRIMSLLPLKVPPFTRTRSWFVRNYVLLNQRFPVAHRNILNLSGDVEAVLGRYENGGNRIHLLLVKYPDAARAGEALAQFRKAYMPDAKGALSVKTENGKWTVARLTGSIVAVVFDAPDETYALKMTGAVSTL